MGRVLTSEILDVLSPDDPRALRSRRDLVLINAVMCQSAIMAEALSAFAGAQACWPIWAAATAASCCGWPSAWPGAGRV